MTWRGLVARKRRLVATSLAIVLGVGFIAGVSVLSETVRRAFDDLFAGVYRGTDVVVVPQGQLEGGGFRQSPKRLSPDLLDRVRVLPEVAVATGTVRSYAQAVDARDTPIGGSNSPTFGEAWNPETRLNPFTIAEGRPPQSDDEVAVDRNTALVGKLTVGSDVGILTLSGRETYRLVGLTRFGGADSPAGASYIHFTGAEAARNFRTDGLLDQLAIGAAPGVSPEQARDAVNIAIGDPTLEIVTGAEATTTRQNDLQEGLKGFTTFLLVFGYVALLVGSFVIFNTFQILVAQRRRELALLRAVGAHGRQVLGTVIAEAFAVGLVASALGIGAGILLALGLRALLSSLGFRLPVEGLVVQPSTFVVGVLAGIAVTVAAALVPAWRAARIPPIAALSEGTLERRTRSPGRVVLGLVVLVAALVSLGQGLRSTGNPAVYGVGIAGALTLVAFALLGPALLVPFADGPGRVLRARGAAGRLAQGNVTRAPRRNALTALALTVGLALVGMIVVFAGSFQKQIDRTIEGRFAGDFFVTSAARIVPLPTVVAERLRDVPEVGAFTRVRFAFGASIVDDAGKELQGASGLVAVDTATVGRTVDLPVLDGSITDVGPGAIAVDRRNAEVLGVGVGDSVNVRFRGDPVPVRVAAILDGEKIAAFFQGITALIDISTWDANYANPVDALLYVDLDGEATPARIAAARVAITAALADLPTVQVSDLASYRRLVRGQLAPFLGFVFALLGISLVIAGIGVANTLKLSVTERTRELGLLRAVGMHRRQARSMVRWEAVVISVFGAVAGVLIGTTFGVFLMISLRSQGFTEIAVPVTPLLGVTLGAAVLGLVAAVGAARRASRLDVLAAIATD